MKRTLALVATLIALLPVAAGALDIRFDYRFDEAGFFAAPERRAALELAALLYEARIDGTLAGLPAGEWVAELPNPGDGERETIEDLEIPADTLVVFVGARPLQREGRLAMGGPGAWRLPCSVLFGLPLPCSFDPAEPGSAAPLHDWIQQVVFRARPSARRHPALGFAPWGGFLVFDDAVDWYFGLDPDVPAQRLDFVSAAIHELGHVLGVGTAESWGTHTPREGFEGPEVEALRGGPVSLAEDLAHWAPGTQGSPPAVGAAAFVPGLAAGERRELTELDVAALLDIGWSRQQDVSVSPGEHSAYYDAFIRGDLDGDGQVAESDVRMLEAFLAPGLSAPELSRADVHPLYDDGTAGDDRVDANDLEVLRRALAWRESAVDGELRHPLCPQLDPLLCALLLGPHAGGPGFLDAFDESAFRVLGLRYEGGWPPLPDPHIPPGGDVDGNAVLDAEDLALVEAEVDRVALEDPRSRAAADVAPMLLGNSQGDGRVDEWDLALLRRAVAEEDIDGDGFPTALENELNMIWMYGGLGRPRHHPLLRWTDECLQKIEVEEGASALDLYLLGFLGGPEAPAELRFDFCSRDGSPWSPEAAVSPDQYRAIRDADEVDVRAPPRPAARPDAGENADTAARRSERTRRSVGGWTGRRSAPQEVPPETKSEPAVSETPAAAPPPPATREPGEYARPQAPAESGAGEQLAAPDTGVGGDLVAWIEQLVAALIDALWRILHALWAWVP